MLVYVVYDKERSECYAVPVALVQGFILLLAH